MVTGIDLSDSRIAEAEAEATGRGPRSMRFTPSSTATP